MLLLCVYWYNAKSNIFLQDYYETISKYFEDAPLNIPVKYKVRQIANKMELLDREIKYLLNKVKIWKPKQEAAANQTTDSKIEPEEEQPSDNLEEQQQEPVTETTDTTQDPVSKSEEPQLPKEEVQGKEHQEL